MIAGTSSARSFTFISLFLIAAVCLIAYSNTFYVPFQFDDPGNIDGKPFVRDIGMFFDPARFSPDSVFIMRPVAYFTLAVNYRIHGTDVVGYHIVNLVIHILNGFLVYFLVLMTFKTLYFKNEETGTALIALFTALLFVSHPVQTQAVTYIIQRTASLAALFYLLSLVMYIKSRLASRQAGKLTGYALSLLSAVVAMKTKEMAFTLPLVIVLYEFLFFTGHVRKRILYLLPLLLTTLIIPVSLISIGEPTGEIIGDMSEATRLGTALPRWDYLFTQFRVIVTYIRLLFLPVNQNLDFDYPLYHSLFEPDVFLSFLFLFSIFCVAVYLLYASRRQKPAATPYPLLPTPYTLPLSPYSRLVSFGILWFFITLSVESSIIPIVDVIFEHRLYLPSVGFFIAVTAGSFMGLGRFKEKRQWAGKAAVWGFIAVVILLSGATYARNAVWQSAMSLWKDVLQKSPAKVRAVNNVGLAFMNQGNVDKAAEMYSRAIVIDPKVAEPHYNLGKTYEKKGRYDEAIEEYKKAVSLEPEFADAYFDLGVTYALKGMREEAIRHYKTAVSQKPDFARAHFNLGVIYLGEYLAKEAADEFEAALRSDPSLDQARMFLEYARRLQ